MTGHLVQGRPLAVEALSLDHLQLIHGHVELAGDQLTRSGGIDTLVLYGDQLGEYRRRRASVKSGDKYRLLIDLSK